MSKQVILIGYSGHAFVGADILLAAGVSIAGYCDNEQKTFNPFNLDYKGNEIEFFKDTNNLHLYNAFICIGDNRIREKIYQNLSSLGVSFINAIHPTAVIGKGVSLGTCIFIAANATINPCCTIGNGSILNTSCSIDHECKIGDFAHIAPGTVLCGNVTVGQRSFIGANSTIIPGKIISNDIIVGAGGVVTKNLSDKGIYKGSPATFCYT